MQPALFDTSIYITSLRRGNDAALALRRLAEDAPLCLSSVVLEELYAGAGDRERRVLGRLERDFDRVKRMLVPNLSDWTQTHLSLEDTLSIGIDRMQRNFEPMRQQVESWRAQLLSPESAKLTIYRAFVEGDLDVPRHLARRVHDLYFNPEHEEFVPRTMWSLSNAFTSAFKELDPIPQFRATAKLANFLDTIPTWCPR